jgi:hypothetical protein
MASSLLPAARDEREARRSHVTLTGILGFFGRGIAKNPAPCDLVPTSFTYEALEIGSCAVVVGFGRKFWIMTGHRETPSAPEAVLSGFRVAEPFAGPKKGAAQLFDFAKVDLVLLAFAREVLKAADGTVLGVAVFFMLRSGGGFAFGTAGAHSGSPKRM